MAAKTPWRPHDTATPIGQGDLIITAWAKTISPQESRLPGAFYPIPSRRDAFDMKFWGDRLPEVLETWGRLNYSLAVVITESCAIDKEFNVLRDQYTSRGESPEAAAKLAHEHADPFLTIAEAWPTEAFPDHLQRTAASGALGYVPVTLEALVPEDTRPYTIDLSRVATVSWRAIDRRLGVADSSFVSRLQVAICRFYAARNIRITEELTRVFDRTIERVEALTPPGGNPPRARIRLHFETGEPVVLEAALDRSNPEEAPESGRSGFGGRR